MQTNDKYLLEALLFAAGEPVLKSRLAALTELSESEVEKLAQELKEEYDENMRGFSLIELNEKYQLCSRKDYFQKIREMLEIKRNSPLSSAAFEVLAVIAYNQPVTKSFVEQVRGVDCSGVISSLYDKGLIEEKGRLELPGKPLIYGTTDTFLRCFGVKDLSELPPLPQKQESAADPSDNDGTDADKQEAADEADK